MALEFIKLNIRIAVNEDNVYLTKMGLQSKGLYDRFISEIHVNYAETFGNDIDATKTEMDFTVSIPRIPVMMSDFANCQSPKEYPESFRSVSAVEPLDNGVFMELTVIDMVKMGLLMVNAVAMGFEICQCAYEWNRSDQYRRELKQENDEMV